MSEDLDAHALQSKIMAMESSVIQAVNVMVQMQTLLLLIKSHTPGATADTGISAEIDEMFKRTEDLMVRLRRSNEIEL